MTRPGYARLIQALVAVAAWAAITMTAATLQTTSNMSLQELVTQHIAWGVAAAALFLLVVARLAGWFDLGFRRPMPPSSLALLWLPALYLVALGGLGLLTGRLSLSAVTVVLVNCTLVGFSEELAFRGVLWGAARRVLTFWPGFLLVSLAFGSVHVFNAIITGELAAAGIQALNAFMSGVAYLAIRIRTRSIIPIMLIHALWDLCVFGSGSGAGPVADQPDLWKSQLTGGLMLIAPLFVYGLWLVRNERVRAGWRDDSYDPAPSTIT